MLEGMIIENSLLLKIYFQMGIIKKSYSFSKNFSPFERKKIKKIFSRLL